MSPDSEAHARVSAPGAGGVQAAGDSGIRDADWTLAVLCGGRSRRFGRDKALASLDVGRPDLLGHLVRRLAPPATPVILATRPSGPGSSSGWPCVLDRDSGAGPLAATSRALSAAKTPWVLIVPVDTPALPEDLPQRMLELAVGATQAVACALEGAIQPLPVLLSRSLAGSLSARVAAGSRRMLEALEGAETRVIALDELYPGERASQALVNVNTRDALARASSATRDDRTEHP